MLEHLRREARAPERVVIMGAAGFVGGALHKRLERDGTEVLALTRAEVDLLAEGAAEKLASQLKPTDSFAAVAAMAPCKSLDMFMDNMRMVQAICAALSARPVAHLVNISSDAVYADSSEPMSEQACASPDNLHGMMHLAREVMFRTSIDVPMATLRPSLLYGADDPHNGYGPNRFRRLATTGQDIVLFGEGEERRDHVLIDDVAEIAARVLMHRSTGTLNIATGTVTSFREIAEMVVSHFDQPAPIKGSPRTGPMPHNGYRAFDPAATYSAFPDFRYTQPAEGLTQVHAAALGPA